MELLCAEKDFAVCRKPVGLDSEHEVPRLLREQLGGEIYTVHRLDKNVGGVMVYARTPKGAAELSRLIREGQLLKEYVALVHGTPAPEGYLTDFLYKDSRKNKVFAVKKPRAGVKEAALSYRCLRSGEESLVQVLLHTGRSHQIRVQFASRGYPLVGDHKYGSRSPLEAPRLWSCRLTFPWEGKTLTFTDLPEWAEGVKLENLRNIKNL